MENGETRKTCIGVRSSPVYFHGSSYQYRFSRAASCPAKEAPHPKRNCTLPAWRLFEDMISTRKAYNQSMYQTVHSAKVLTLYVQLITPDVMAA